MDAEAILRQILPPTLQTPHGWKNQILQWDQRYVQTNDNIQQIYTEDQYNFNVQSSNIIQENLNEQEIIRRVEQGQQRPLIVRKKLPNNSVTYQQNVSLRYLQPPPLPPPGPLIIREVRPPAPPPPPPIQITQRPPPPKTPPPLVLRERPPPPPAALPTKVINKVLPPAPAGPRRVIIERFGAPPPKPRNVIIERWLPFKKPAERKVLVERAPPLLSNTKSEPNLLILYNAPEMEVRRHFINQGVVRADPRTYLQTYGSELNTHLINSSVVDEATRAVPPPPPVEPVRLQRSPSPPPADPVLLQPPSPPPIAESASRIVHEDSYRPLTPPYISNSRWVDRERYLPRSNSYHYYEPRRYYHRYEYEPSSRRPHYYENYRSSMDLMPSWDRYYPSSSYRYSPDTIHVRSEGDFRRVMDLLTDRRPRSRYYASDYYYYC